MNTKEKILREAVKLFAEEGFEAVTVERIAAAVGIKAPSLYKHYRSKRDIFDSILNEMERRDRDNAEASSVPEESIKEKPDEYTGVRKDALLSFCRKMFRYWTEDEFASSFRKMLTIEQFRSSEMNMLYHQYLGEGPLRYTADILSSEEEALALYAPMYLLYGIYDEGRKEEAFDMLDRHLERWRRQN